MTTRTIVAVVALSAALSAGRAVAHGTSSETTAQIEARVAYYLASTQKYARHYPGYCELGRAYLDLAKQTGDPAWLGAARAALATSIGYQPTFEAYRGLMLLENHAHHFREALEWGRLGGGASNEGIDPEILSGLVEAHMGLGEDDAALKLLGKLDVVPTTYHGAAALARYQLAEGRTDAALAALAVAAQLASDQRFPEHAAWAEATAGRALLDAGRAAEARRKIARAELLSPHGSAVAVLRGRVLELDGRAAEAAAIYRDALQLGPDPELYRRLFLVTRRLGDAAGASQAFDQAVRLARVAIDAGEIYSLGSLVQLYLDEGAHLAEARALAEENWRYKRDRESARQRTATRGGPSGVAARRRSPDRPPSTPGG